MLDQTKKHVQVIAIAGSYVACALMAHLFFENTPVRFGERLIVLFGVWMICVTALVTINWRRIVLLLPQLLVLWNVPFALYSIIGCSPGLSFC